MPSQPLNTVCRGETPAIPVPASGVKARALGSARARAMVSMGSAAVLFSLMVVFTKAASKTGGGRVPLPGAEIAIFRYVFGLAILLVFNRVWGSDLLGKDRAGLFLRGIYGGIASVAYFLGIANTSITHATLLNSTQVIWGPLFAIYALNERLKWHGVFALAVALSGVILVTHPQTGSVHIGDAFALISGVISGLAMVQIRRLRQLESSYAIFCYFNLLGLPIAIAALLVDHEHLVWPAHAQWPLLLGMGVASVAAQLLTTYGFRALTAAQGSLISLTQVVFSALFALTIFGELLPPTTLLGGALILAAAATPSIAQSLVRTEPAVEPVPEAPLT